MKRATRVKAVRAWVCVDETGQIPPNSVTSICTDEKCPDALWSDSFHTYHWERVLISPIPKRRSRK